MKYGSISTSCTAERERVSHARSHQDSPHEGPTDQVGHPRALEIDDNDDLHMWRAILLRALSQDPPSLLPALPDKLLEQVKRAVLGPADLSQIQDRAGAAKPVVQAGVKVE